MQSQPPLTERYRPVWERTIGQGALQESDVAQSQFFFDSAPAGGLLLREGRPVPKRFDTYAIVCCLPFSEEFQRILENLWQEFMELLGNPLAYGVELSNRHVEIFLFQRPGELFPQTVIDEAMRASIPIAEKLSPFTISFAYPFMTPDGTIVVPGFVKPEGVIDGFREGLKNTLTSYPQKQSQWLHTSLGRVLEPLDSTRLAPLIDHMNSHWGQEIGKVEVDKLLWTHEKQWYMVDKTILHQIALKKS